MVYGHRLGKTVTTLTALQSILYDNLEAGPVLVIAPKRVAENTWTKEVQKWPHLAGLRVTPIMGSRDSRTRAVSRALSGQGDIYVINRENVVWLTETLGRLWPFHIVVIDELSSFKSAQAKRWKALRRVRGSIDRIIGLTGTPRPNGLEDLWPEIYLLDRGERLGARWGFSATLICCRIKETVPSCTPTRHALGQRTRFTRNFPIFA